MAEIFRGLAYDLSGIKKTVCIKKILSHIAASREFIDMLVDEAKIAVRLNHGNIAQVYDLGKAGEDYFIVMEYVEGQTLSKIFKKVSRQKKRLPIPIVCNIISEIASGLNYMHCRSDENGEPLNIIHRDISPQNLMVSYSGIVKIIDFGIAKAAVKIGQTESGILKGKFAYMSPEQAYGDPLDHRSDIFSLGVIFHELLTGKRLFKAEENKQTLKNVKRAKVLAPSQIVPEIPKELDQIVLKALERDRRHRYAFASDFQEALLRFLHLHYPDFKPSDGSEYLQKLFQQEILLSQHLIDEEGATPHLLLEKTEASADGEHEKSEVTSGKAGGIDWREFMLEEDWPKEEKKEEDISESSPSLDKGEKEEKTNPKWFSWPIQQSVIWGSFFFLFLVVGTFWIYPRLFPNRHRTALQTANEVPSLPPQKAFAKIRITSNPSGAQIFLNDQESGYTTPATLSNLDPNQKYMLGLYFENYQFYKKEFETKENEIENFHVELALDYGRLQILSEPTGATVLLNGSLIGQTPWTQEKMTPGEIVQIELQYEGFLPHKEEIQIRPGKDLIIHAHLERSPPLQTP